MSGVEKIGFIGGGNMGEALIKGLIQSGRSTEKDIYVFDPEVARTEYLSGEYRINVLDSGPAIVEECNIVFLAVKPQVIDKVLDETGPAFTEDSLVISVAAGVTLTQIQAAIQTSAPVIRVMPNTPALVLAGASAMTPGAFAQKEHMDLAASLFESVGETVIVDEKMMDVVTGLSGSGPAYVFMLLEALTDGAVRLGLPRPQALKLAGQTVLGAAKMVVETGEHPARLRDMVTSPGGTTAAGLHALEKGAFRAVLMDAVAAAAAKARELGSK